ncbi:MAG TPA: metallophosphoesterase [Longimicrobium sp.]|nr:metallophosphoesterase [Longimicrobium sp.]
MSTPDPSLPTVIPPITGTIWHLTDLHFNPGALPGSPDDKSGAPGGLFETDVFQKLYEYAAENPATVLVASGDFVEATAVRTPDRTALAAQPASNAPNPYADLSAQNTPRRDAFLYAAKFLRTLASKLGIADEDWATHVVVCPGNHDVDWAVAVSDPKHSLDSFGTTLNEFLSPMSDVPLVRLEKAGLAILALDTAFLGGTEFHRIAKGLPVQVDAAAYALSEITRAVKRLGLSDSDEAVPQGMLGLVVAHHPPTVTPSATAEVKPFEIPIASAQAKRQLFRKGFRVFMHGHKHIPVTVRESWYLGQEDLAEEVLVVGGGAFGSTGDTWFTVIRYAVSPLTGEARLRVEAHSYAGYAPRRVGSRLFTVPPRNRSPIGLIRVTERINANGDSRLDYEFCDVPVSEGGRPCPGWKREKGVLVREFERVQAADDDVASPPLVAPLTDNAAIVVVGLDQKMLRVSNRAYRIRVAVIADSDAPAQSVSFMERSFVNGTYAVSKYHQRAVAGVPRAVQPLPYGWEGLLHIMREPADRLDMAVHLPFPSGSTRVELVSVVERDGGELDLAPQLEAFSDPRVERNVNARCIRASVSHPIVGVGYLLRWELPEFTPTVSLGQMDEGFLDALDVAEEIRKTLLLERDAPDSVTAEFRRVMDALFAQLVEADGLSNADQPEWAVFVPQTPIISRVPDEGMDEVPAPTLRPAMANFSADDPRWKASLRAGKGIVGRAYALNAQVRYFGPESGKRRRRPANQWLDPELPIYVPVAGSLTHSVLYALPLHVPGRAPDVVWGVLCIGTAHKWPKLNLDVPVEPSETAPGPRASNGSLAVMSGVGVFTRKLLRMIECGIPIAEPIATAPMAGARGGNTTHYLPPWSFVGDGVFVRSVPAKAFPMNREPVTHLARRRDGD